MKAALSAMTVKTDRKDACGLAHLLRMGWFQQVHAKSIGSQEIRALLVARKQLLGRTQTGHGPDRNPAVQRAPGVSVARELEYGSYPPALTMRCG